MAPVWQQPTVTPGDQVKTFKRYVFLCIPVIQSKKIAADCLGTGASSATGLLEVFRQSTSWLLTPIPSLLSGDNDNFLSCKSISALDLYIIVFDGWLLDDESLQLMPAVTALL